MGVIVPHKNPMVIIGTAKDALRLQQMVEQRRLHSADFLFEPDSRDEYFSTLALPEILKDRRGSYAWAYAYTDPKSGRDVVRLKWEMSDEDKAYFFNPLTLYDQKHERTDLEALEDGAGDL